MSSPARDPYLFRRRDDGALVELRLTRAELEAIQVCGVWAILPDGSEARRAVAEELEREAASRPCAPRLRRGGRGAWPMRPCSGSGVLPRQVPALRRKLAAAGVRDTEFDARGRPIFRTAKHQAEFLAARGMRVAERGEPGDDD